MALLLVLVSVGSAGAEPESAGADPSSLSAPPSPPSDVRQGTTSVTAPAEAARPDVRSEAAERLAPGDAPRLTGALPRLPEPPPSFNVYDGGWIRFAYPPSVRERVQPLIASADDVRAELSAWLGQAVLRKLTVYIGRTPGEMATLAPEGAPFPKYASGVAYSELGLVLLTIGPVYPNARHELEEIFRHEMTHVALHDATSGRPLPRWFNEGLAVFASGESSFDRMRTLSTATLAGTLLPLRQLERTFPADAVSAEVAYAQAADVVRFLMRQQDRHRFTALIERMAKGQPFESALHDSYGIDLQTLEYEWREDVAKRYTFWPVLFSGTAIWAGVITLFVWAWRRKRRKNQETLDRWAREEAAEDELRKRLEAAEQSARVHIVLARKAAPQLRGAPELEVPEVPKVEHEGQWHTLH
jgi:hypothetical protein